MLLDYLVRILKVYTLKLLGQFKNIMVFKSIVFEMDKPSTQ
jgi:hypothetical protein